MCGIAGYVYLDGRPVLPDADRPLLGRMGEAMAHRGPDDSRVICWNNVGMVFRRLSINDIEGGAQPFDVCNGRISAMTNGEIYNHRDLRKDLGQRHTLRTTSDCEVLPYLYLDRGLRMFDPVNGMFATALLDRENRRLLLARDRLGEKPLFYCVLPGKRMLVFASELKALFAHPEVPRRFDWRTMLTQGQNIDTSLGERPSGFVGVERLPAGAILDLSLIEGSFRIHRYWQLPQRLDTGGSTDADEYVEQYRALLEDSVRLREIADVGCGLFLSGGIDSSAVAALCARKDALPTFSIRNASTLADANAAARVASHLGMANHQIDFDSTAFRPTPDTWRRVLWSCELADSTAEQLFKYYLHAFAHQRYPNLKVMLLGQGSDEFNGGYMGMVLNRPGPYVAQDWDHMGNTIRERDDIHVAFTSGLIGRAKGLVEHGVIRRDFIRALGGRETGSTAWDTYVSLYRGNLDYHLWHEDRTAAAHSIENRVPFLDHRLVEFQAQIPQGLHSSLFTDKRILRLATRDLLPEDVVNRPKGPLFYGSEQHHTFRMMHAMLTSNHGELLDQAIEGSTLTDGPIDAANLRAMASKIARDPSLADLGQLLSIVNMGLLAYMALTSEVPSTETECLAREYVAPPWNMATQVSPEERVQVAGGTGASLA
jgi:asparagine synthase (glutamine-hydrolysing)